MPKYLVTAVGRAGLEVSADSLEAAVRWAAKHGPKFRGIVHVISAERSKWVIVNGLRFKISPSGKKVKQVGRK